MINMEDMFKGADAITKNKKAPSPVTKRVQEVN